MSAEEDALDGIKVLDLCRDLSGPLTAMMLAEFGADVIEIEHHLTGDETRVWPPIVGGISGYYAAINRSKRSFAVDLKDSDGFAAVFDLAAQADVVMQAFTPGVADRLGLGYEAIRAVNPGVVYYSLSGYGQDGPWREKRGYDPILQAASGFMSLTGENGRGPVKSIVPVADLASSIYGYAAIMTALFRKQRTGNGQHIDNSMMDVGVSMLTAVGTRYLWTGLVPERNGTENPQRVPSAAFECGDGRFLQVVPNQRQWSAFCGVLGCPDWVTDERYATPVARIDNQAELYPLIRKVFLTRPAAEWNELLDAATIACSPIYGIDEVFDLPQTKARGMVQHYHRPGVGDMPAIALPFKLSETPTKIRSAPPQLGQHGSDILRELGRSEEQIAAMLERRAITVVPEVADAATTEDT